MRRLAVSSSRRHGADARADGDFILSFPRLTTICFVRILVYSKRWIRSIRCNRRGALLVDLRPTTRAQPPGQKARFLLPRPPPLPAEGYAFWRRAANFTFWLSKVWFFTSFSMVPILTGSTRRQWDARPCGCSPSRQSFFALRRWNNRNQNGSARPWFRAPYNHFFFGPGGNGSRFRRTIHAGLEIRSPWFLPADRAYPFLSSRHRFRISRRRIPRCWLSPPPGCMYRPVLPPIQALAVVRPWGADNKCS